MKNILVLYLILGFVGFFVGYFILGPIINPRKSEDKIKIEQLQYSKDSVIDYYSDISNCIREDFGIDTTKKVMYYQVKIKYKKRK